MNIKKIIVPTDFSDTANNALMYAKDIAERYSAEINIVHVFTIPLLTARGVPVFPDDELVKAELKAVEEQLNHIKKRVSEISSVKCTTNAILIHWQIEFAEAIHNQKVDLIIVGNTGASGIKKIFMGSNAARIIKDSPIPVLAIPENAKLSHFHKIGFAYDGLQLNEIGKHSILTSLMSTLKARVHVFQIINKKQSTTSLPSKIHEFFKDAEYSEINESEVEQGILKAVELYHLDMIIMCPRQNSFFHNLVYGSITARVAYEISVPLLAIPKEI